MLALLRDLHPADIGEPQQTTAAGIYRGTGNNHPQAAGGYGRQLHLQGRARRSQYQLVVIETLTALGSRFVMAQRFIPEIVQGDKRILLVDGQPVPYALARIPAAGEVRGNLAAGGRGVGVPLSPRDYWICEQVGPELRRRGLLFVGLDVIGDYLTEINVTSPTCIRELDKQYGLDIAGDLMEAIVRKLAERAPV